MGQVSFADALASLIAEYDLPAQELIDALYDAVDAVVAAQEGE